MRAYAKFVKYSICECGFPILSEDVPLGTVYVVHPDERECGRFRCGGCGKIIEAIPCIVAESRAGGRPGFLPAEIFEIDEGLIPEKVG